MRKTLMAFVLSLVPVAAFAAGTGSSFACDMRALTTEQRTVHARLARELFAAVKTQRELPNGYAFRLASDRWLDAARWVDLERRCCPFFAFELTAAPDGGDSWLRVTGKPGAKAFMKAEFGL